MSRCSRWCLPLLLLTAPLPGAAGAAEAPALPPVDEAALRGHVHFLADDLLEGRGTATRGFAVAARYVASELQALGLAPLGADGSYELPVRLLRARPVVAQSRLAVVRRGGAETVLVPLVDYSWTPSFVRDDASLDGVVLFVGYGVTAADMGYDDYAGLDVRGRVVAIADGAPASFDHDRRAVHAARETKLANALAHGAAAVLTFRDPLGRVPSAARFRELAAHAERQGALTWIAANGEAQGAYPGLLARASLSASGVEKLFGRERARMLAALRRARSGRPASFALGHGVRLRLVGTREAETSANVGALLRGSDPGLAGEYVVVTAHLDHLGVNETLPPDRHRIYNGAYDNAVGVAALLEVARCFARVPQRPRRSLAFVALTGEEAGLLGARAFVDAPPVPIAAIVADLNLDMFLAPFPVADVVGFGAEHSTLGPVLRRAADAAGFAVSPDPEPEEVIFVRSDQYAFVRRGIPSLFVTEGTHSRAPGVDGARVLARWRAERYHTVRDDLDQPFDWPSLRRWTQLDFLIAAEVAQADERPRWNDGDFFARPAGGAARP